MAAPVATGRTEATTETSTHLRREKHQKPFWVRFLAIKKIGQVHLLHLCETKRNRDVRKGRSKMRLGLTPLEEDEPVSKKT